MAVTALYRINGGEVLKISPTGQPFTDRDTTYWGVLVDPILVNGNQVRETLPDGTLGPLKVFGFAQIALPGTNTCRLALQAEVDNFTTAETADENAQDAEDAARWVDTHPRFRKFAKAFLKRIIAENNQAAAQWNAFRAEVANANNLGSLRDGIAANTTDLPTRTLQQAVTAILADIDAGD